MERAQASSVHVSIPIILSCLFHGRQQLKPSLQCFSSIAAVWIKAIGVTIRMNCQLTSVKHRYLSPLPRFLPHFSQKCVMRVHFNYSNSGTENENKLLSRMWSSILFQHSYGYRSGNAKPTYRQFAEEIRVWCKNVYTGRAGIPALWVGKRSSLFSSSSTLREGTPVIVDM